MSANTYWSPIRKGTSLNCLSNFFDVIARARHDTNASELILNGEDIARLDGIAAGDPSTQGAVDDLVAAIEKHNEIRVWREY